MHELFRSFLTFYSQISFPSILLDLIFTIAKYVSIKILYMKYVAYIEQHI